MEKPWKSIHKTPIDELTDSLYMLPAVFRQLDGLLNESCDSNLVELQDGFRDVIQKLLKTKSALNDIFREFERSVCGPLYWPELSILPSHLDDTQLGKVFPISFKFPAFTVSQFLTNYWSGLMAIHNQLMFTYCRLSMVQGAISAANLGDTSRSFPPRHSTSTSSSPASISSLKSSEHHNEWKNMARNLCQSAEYFLQGDKGEFGPLTLLMLLSGCYSCFKHFPAEMSREIGWVAEIQSQVQKKANLPFLDPYEDSVTVQQSGIVSNNATSLPTPFTLQQT